MSSIFNQIPTYLATTPGNLVYHLVLAFSVAGALLVAIDASRGEGTAHEKRTILGLSLLLVIQISMFVISGLAWKGYLDPRVVLPPLDRAATLFSLLIIGWLWIFPEPARVGNLATLMIGFLVLILAVASIVLWLGFEQATSFNDTYLEWIWQAASLCVIILCGVMLGIRRPGNWGSGLAMFILAFLGHLTTIIFSQPGGDYPGLVRLSQIAMFPILLTLPQRSPGTIVEQIAAAPVMKEEQDTDNRKYTSDPKAFHALLNLAAETNASNIAHALTRSIAQAMLADLCFLIHLSEDKNIIITSGYDLIREENLEGTTIHHEEVPLLANAIQRGRALRLPASSTSTDLKNLGQYLGVETPGHLLSIPINSVKNNPVGALLLLSPYSNRLWSAEDQSFLTNVSSLFLPILDRGKRMSQVEQELKKTREQLNQKGLSDQDDFVFSTPAKSRMGGGKTEAGKTADFLASQAGLQQMVDTLQAENLALRRSAAGGAGTGTERLENELHDTLAEVARLQNKLAEVNMRTMGGGKKRSSSRTGEQSEVLASISQELRQPMSSIVGYTDLLLGESVGILGALQRKFLERIKVATERISGLINDLIQLTTTRGRESKNKQESIDLNLIIDNAMAQTSTQLREKDITLRLDLPESPPRIQADQESLLQILVHLLQNAGSASPEEGTVILRAGIQNEGGKEYLHLQVTDSGGGIPPEEIPQVFDQKYRADHVLIQGVGDTGVGLSLAKNLVETQKGSISVESKKGSGSTFSVRIPVVSLPGEAED